MQHRHLASHVGWPKVAIDSALERGSLPEWRKLFDDARRDPDLAAQVIDVARRHPMPGVTPIVERVLGRAWPNLNVLP